MLNSSLCPLHLYPQLQSLLPARQGSADDVRKIASRTTNRTANGPSPVLQYGPPLHLHLVRAGPGDNESSSYADAGIGLLNLLKPFFQLRIEFLRRSYLGGELGHYVVSLSQMRYNMANVCIMSVSTTSIGRLPLSSRMEGARVPFKGCCSVAVEAKLLARPRDVGVPRRAKSSSANVSCSELAVGDAGDCGVVLISLHVQAGVSYCMYASFPLMRRMNIFMIGVTSAGDGRLTYRRQPDRDQS